MKIINSKLSLLALLFLTIFASSCNDDSDNTPKGQYESGILIINEGNYTTKNASISHLSGETVTNDIFYTANNEMDLGDVAQSVTVDGDETYIIVNNSNKIEVVNSYTFELITTIEIEQPRYMIVHNGKGYVTQWASIGGQVNVIDLASYQSTDTIPGGLGTNNLIAKDNKLYVSNNWTNTVTIVDLATYEKITDLEVGSSPGAYVIDANNDLWLICSGGSDENWVPLNDGKIVKISNDNTVSLTLELNKSVKTFLSTNKAKDALFYLDGPSVKKMDISSTPTVPTTDFIALTGVSPYGLGVDPSTDEIFVGDAASFQGSGKVLKYSATGASVDSYTVGVAPNGFVFK